MSIQLIYYYYLVMYLLLLLIKHGKFAHIHKTIQFQYIFIKPIIRFYFLLVLT